MVVRWAIRAAGGRTDADLDRGAIRNQFVRHQLANRLDDPPLLLANRRRQQRGIASSAVRSTNQSISEMCSELSPQIRGQSGSISAITRSALRASVFDMIWTSPKLTYASRVGRRYAHQIDVEIVESGRQRAFAIIGERHEFARGRR